MQWWCFAQTEPWSWRWQPYLGVWVLVALLVWGYARMPRSAGVLGGGAGDHPGGVEGDDNGGGGGEPWWRTGSFVLGVLLLWVSLDWPVGPLGASYFASVHMAQYVAVGVAVPALLLVGVPPATFQALSRRLESRPRARALVEAATHPLVAFAVFNGVMTVTHWPSVVDTLMRTQAGSFLLDASWMAAGLLFWWPVLVPVPERPGFRPLGKIGYLALNAFLIRPPFAMMIFSEDPIYRIYELAPPPAPDAMDDQQLGGVIMKIGVAWVMFAGVAGVFLGWMREEERGQALPDSGH